MANASYISMMRIVNSIQTANPTEKEEETMAEIYSANPMTWRKSKHYNIAASYFPKPTIIAILSTISTMPCQNLKMATLGLADSILMN